MHSLSTHPRRIHGVIQTSRVKIQRKNSCVTQRKMSQPRGFTVAAPLTLNPYSIEKKDAPICNPLRGSTVPLVFYVFIYFFSVIQSVSKQILDRLRNVLNRQMWRWDSSDSLFRESSATLLSLRRYPPSSQPQRSDVLQAPLRSFKTSPLAICVVSSMKEIQDNNNNINI